VNEILIIVVLRRIIKGKYKQTQQDALLEEEFDRLSLNNGKIIHNKNLIRYKSLIPASLSILMESFKAKFFHSVYFSA
jgi:hypothetical protein